MVDLQKLMGLDALVPQIKLRPLEHLVHYARNSRTHSPAQLAELEALMKEFGWTNPVLVDDMGIVAGHGRCMAAEQLYKRGEQILFPGGQAIPIGLVPTIDCTGWSPEQRKAYIIADNRSALSAGWDEDLLRAELLELDEAGFDLSLTAFSDEELASLLAVEPVDNPDVDPDSVPDAGGDQVTVPGDVWVLGPHRVCCGDATLADDWDRLMGTERADAVWTDPPYNVDQDRKNRELDKLDGGNSRSSTGTIQNDNLSGNEFYQLLLGAFSRLFEVMKPGAPIYVAHADIEGKRFRDAFCDAGLHLQSCLVWRKNVMVLGCMDWQSIHEPILYGWKKGSRHRWYGGRKNTSVIDLGEGSPFERMEDGRYQVRIGDSVLVVSADAVVEQHEGSMLYEPRPTCSGLHPTQKPVALIERMLRNSARTGDIVVDAFGGSGSTLIAADRLAMCARVMELSPEHCDTIVRRWQDYTGRQAVHAVTGEVFGAGPRLPQPDPADGDIF